MTQNIIDELIYGEKGNEVVLIKYLKPEQLELIRYSPPAVVFRRVFIDHFYIQLDRNLIPDHPGVKIDSEVCPAQAGVLAERPR